MNKNTLARNIVLWKELEKILEKFNEKNIGVILLKGCSLLGRIYTDFSQREMEDIDLLVQGEDIPQIKGILSSLGYRQLPAGDWEFVKIYSENFPPIMLDLQEKLWYITNTREIWDESLTVEIDKVKVKVLSPEEEIIFLAVYRIVHHGKLDKVCLLDIKKIVEQYQGKICWEKIVGKIRNYALESMLYFVFTKVESIPLWVKTEIKPIRRFGGLFPWLLKLFSYSQEYENIGHFLRPLTFPTLFGKINFLFNFFFPGKDFLIRRYGLRNNRSAFFYFFLRPVILVFRAFRLSVSIFLNCLGLHSVRSCP